MAGVKGRSGGARPNSGGKRPNAGRKPKAKPGDSANEPQEQVVDPVLGLDGKPAGRREPLTFLEDVLNMPDAPLKDRIRSAIAAAQYRHTKRGDGGKKDEAADKAKKVASGKFKAAPAPLKLVSR